MSDSQPPQQIIEDDVEEDDVEEDEETEELEANDSPVDSVELSESSSAEVATIRQTSAESLLHIQLHEDTVERAQQIFIEIQEKTKSAEDETDICRSVEILGLQLELQNRNFMSCGVNENMVFDAKAISVNTRITGQLVKHLQTDTKFNANEFAAKILLAFGIWDTDSEDSDDGHNTSRIDPTDWVEFGRKFCRFHNCLPTLDYIYGAFDDLDGRSPEAKQVKPRVRHQRKEPTVETGSTQIDAKSKPEEADTSLLQKIIARLEKEDPRLHKVYKTIDNLENDYPGMDLPLFNVTTNPNSLSETVENAFHSATLFKYGLISLKHEDNAENILMKTVDNSKIDFKKPDQSGHLVFSFTMDDWNKWNEELELKEPVIKHKNNNHNNENPDE